MLIAVDLNADLGEEAGSDAQLLRLVTSANVATGAHAGGGSVLTATVQAAVDSGCAIGAHPSYRDRENFGRVSRAGEVTAREFRVDLIEQIVAVGDACRVRGAQLRHVKAHGALYHDAAVDGTMARLLVEAAKDAGDRLACELVIVGAPGNALEEAARAGGLVYRPEAFADRRYASDGGLVPRSHPGAVVTDPQDVLEQALAIVTTGAVVTIDGSLVAVPARTLCVHGDTPGAVRLAQAIRQALVEAGVHVTADVDG